MLNLIKTKDYYDNALARIYDLMQTDHEENSVEFYELKKLIIHVEEYGAIHHKIRD